MSRREETVTSLLDRVFGLAGGSGVDPGRPAIVGAGDQPTLSYGALARLSGALARRLVAAGIVPGDRVAVLGERSVGQAVAAIAAIRAGASYVPVDGAAPPARMDAILIDAAPRVVLCTSRVPPRLAEVPSVAPGTGTDGRVARGRRLAAELLWLILDRPTWAELRQEGEVFGAEVSPARPARGTDPVYLIFTSGTTGRPKGAINLHRGVGTHLRWMADTFGGAGQVVLHKAPIAFDVGVAEILNPICAGGTVVVPPADWWPGDARGMADLLSDHEVTVLSMVPGMLGTFLAELDAEGIPAPRGLEHLLLGGEAVPSDLARLARRRLRCRVWGLYGPSETAMDVMSVEYTEDLERALDRAPAAHSGGEAAGTDPDGADPNAQRATPAPLLGRPEPGVEAILLGPDSEPVAEGAIGELVLGGPQVGGGYLGRPDLTAAAFPPAPGGGRRYRTGDLARRDPATGFFEYHGRIGDQVKIRGNRIELGEVDRALRGTPGVRAAAARVADDTLWGFVVPDSPPAGGAPEAGRAGHPTADGTCPEGRPGGAALAEAARRHAATLLPAYAVPDRVIVLDELPVNANGKLDRAALSIDRT